MGEVVKRPPGVSAGATGWHHHRCVRCAQRFPCHDPDADLAEYTCASCFFANAIASGFNQAFRLAHAAGRGSLVAVGLQAFGFDVELWRSQHGFLNFRCIKCNAQGTVPYMLTDVTIDHECPLNLPPGGST